MFPATLTRVTHGHIRRILIVLAILTLLAPLTVTPVARANGNPPSVECESPLWNGGYWKIQINDGTPAGIETGGGVASGDISYSATSGIFSWTNDHSSDSVFRWLFKSGQTPDIVHNGLWAPSAGDSGTMPSDLSHVTICFTDPPEPVAPELTLIKNVDNTGGGSADASAWTLEAAGTSGGFSGNGAPATGIVATLGPNTVTADVQYTLSESNGPANYSAGSWSCSIDQGDAVVGNTITLQNGESGVCEITNTYNPEPVAPELTLIKNVDNTGGGSADASAWTLEAAGTSGGFSGNGAPATGIVATLGPNTVTADVQYTLSESNGPANYSAGSWSCSIDQGDAVVGNTITLQNGESGVCEITNTYNPEPVAPELTLIKNVDNTGGGSADASAWTLEAAGTSGGFSGNGAPATGIVATLGPNTVTADVQYTLSESNGPANYSAGSWSCSIDQGDAVVGNTITLQNGESGVCEITNTYNPEPDEPSIHIEKATNGVDADNPTGPQLVVGSTVTWTYVVTNTGDVPLANVIVTDDQAGVTPVYQSGDTNNDNLLDLTETWTYTATGTAVEGQYANIGEVTGFYPQEEREVVDTDPSHYRGYRPPVDPDTPRIQIEKATNGVDADTPAGGPLLEVGSPVTWTYVVTNTGNVPLTNVKVVDDKLGAITCPKTTLIILEQMTCTASGFAELIQYANVGTVSGSYGSTIVTDTDPSHYSGIAVKGTAQLGDTVWLDANNNGIQDVGEVGYNGAKVILTDADGNVVGTLTTSGPDPWDGFYKFVGLDAGTYTATLDLTTIGTYTVTTAKAFTVTLEEGDDFPDADFGLYEAPPPTTTTTTTTPPDETLPKTGADTEGIALLGLGLLMLGALAILATRRRRTEG